jgi:zinc transporter ZupT
MLQYLTTTAFAQITGGTSRNFIDNPIKVNTILELITLILKLIMEVGLPVIAIAIVYVGFKFVMAQGSSDKINEAKEAFLWVVIGAAIVLGAIVIRTIIMGTVESLK